ncbi:SseB family protein [Kineosporia sp. R_H_3]|uniref:SseB family protein n=1 Tax=Kineosporia sp. R_H_3 TaxID=1961848 RepID=UPI000B4BAB78|nr:SseB family protein [Kineosporia sp. R_H_3]
MTDPALEPGGESDSAGVPWRGRTLNPQPFTGDEGGADAALAAALAGHAAGERTAAEVVAALAPSRVLVAVVAVLGEDHPVVGGLRADKGADMALVTLTGADGVRGLPVFTSTAALAAWDAAARPVPVESARAALSAVAEGCDRMLVDLAGPHPFVVRRPAVWALGQGRDWVPSPQDPVVAAAVERATAGVTGVVGVRCEPGATAELKVVLGVRAGLDRAALDDVVRVVGTALGREQDVADRVDSMELVVLPA